jgi:hypothetical protein
MQHFLFVNPTSSRLRHRFSNVASENLDLFSQPRWVWLCTMAKYTKNKRKPALLPSKYRNSSKMKDGGNPLPTKVIKIFQLI